LYVPVFNLLGQLLTLGVQRIRKTNPKRDASLDGLSNELGIFVVNRLDTYDEYLALKETCAAGETYVAMASRPTLDRQMERSKYAMFGCWGDVQVYLDWDDDLITYDDWCHVKEAIQEAYRQYGTVKVETIMVDVIHTLQ
jgi:hypothetical protein